MNTCRLHTQMIIIVGDRKRQHKRKRENGERGEREEREKEKETSIENCAHARCAARIKSCNPLHDGKKSRYGIGSVRGTVRNGTERS